jgi:hypothetical protein
MIKMIKMIKQFIDHLAQAPSLGYLWRYARSFRGEAIPGGGLPK